VSLEESKEAVPAGVMYLQVNINSRDRWIDSRNRRHGDAVTGGRPGLFVNVRAQVNNSRRRINDVTDVVDGLVAAPTKIS
jgi:hypothetical protein